MSELFQANFKLIILGEGHVGKTSLIKRIVSNEFILGTNMTLGISEYTKEIKTENFCATLSIWDTAGQERFQSIVPIYFRGCKAAVIVYDITEDSTFKRVQYWINQVKELGNKDIMLMLIGNKKDLEDQRKISTKTALDIARSNEMLFFETSCLSSENVDLAFNELVSSMYEVEKKVYPSENGAGQNWRGGISLNGVKRGDSILEKKKKGKCCGKKSN